ncbi:MAG: VIT domain-containing protein, partial [Gammaproteobacteria bacterium]
MTVIDNVTKRMMSGIRLSLWLIAMLVVLQPLQASTISHLEQIKIGSLVVEQDGQGELLPLMDTQVKIHINGLIARTELKQYFENPSADVIEATYYFPLPEDAAVDGLVMTIGDRRIVGQIKEKAEAKKVYQAAVKAGKKAAILEQGQANLFRSKVANIGPGEVIEVSLTLYQSVQYQHGQFSLRFPTTITPKYQPQPTQQLTEQFTSGAWQANATERDMTILTVPEAARTDHQLAIDVTLNA